MGRTNLVRRESLLVKKSDPRTQALPHIVTVTGAPILSAAIPAKRLPKGAIPMKDIV